MNKKVSKLETIQEFQPLTAIITGIHEERSRFQENRHNKFGQIIKLVANCLEYQVLAQKLPVDVTMVSTL